MATGAQYVVAAYAVILAAFLLYVVVIGMRLARLAREAELLARLAEEDRRLEEAEAPTAPRYVTRGADPPAVRHPGDSDRPAVRHPRG